MEARPTVDFPPARLEDADSRHAPAAAFRPTPGSATVKPGDRSAESRIRTEPPE